jgi:hypothetical protein
LHQLTKAKEQQEKDYAENLKERKVAKSKVRLGAHRYSSQLLTHHFREKAERMTLMSSLTTL